jgi:hypothetical protein
MYVWNKGKVKIYPHIQIDKLYTYEELYSIIVMMKESLSGLDIIIYNKNEYCYEVNGSWNIIFAIVKNINNKVVHYHYMIRRDSQLNKTYCCPFHNTDYWDVTPQHDILNKEECPDEFEMIEHYFINNYNGIIIDRFLTELP